VLCWWEAGCQVLLEHGAGSSEYEDKQSRLCIALGWGKALALVGVLGMLRNFGGKESFSALLLFFWRRGVGGGWAEQMERRDMSTGVGERCPPTQSQEKCHGQRTL